MSKGGCTPRNACSSLKGERAPDGSTHVLTECSLSTAGDSGLGWPGAGKLQRTQQGKKARSSRSIHLMQAQELLLQA